MTTIAFTRPRDRLEGSVRAAESLGFRPLAAPSLRVLPGDGEAMDSFFAELASGKVDAALFTSVTAVDACARRLGDEGGLARLLRRCELIAIGRATRDRLAQLGAEEALMPAAYTSEGLIEDFSSSLAGKRAVLLRSDKGTPLLREALAAAGADVREIHAYRLEAEAIGEDMERIAAEAASGDVDAFAFSSALSALTFLDHAFRLLGEGSARAALADSTVAAIGPPTADALRNEDVRVDVVASQADFRCMLEDVKAFLRS